MTSTLQASHTTTPWPTRQRIANRLVVYMLGLAATACGGGGSDDSSLTGNPTLALTLTAAPGAVTAQPTSHPLAAADTAPTTAPLPVAATAIVAAAPAPDPSPIVTAVASALPSLQAPATALRTVEPTTPGVSIIGTTPAKVTVPATGSTVAPSVTTSTTPTIATWVTAAAPANGGLPPALSAQPLSRDILAYASPAYQVPMRNIGVQCQGANATLADLPASTQSVDDGTGRLATRFGTAGSAESPVFRLAIGMADVLPAGRAPRCEILSYPMVGSAIPANTAFWFAVSMWVDDWAGSSDEQILAQMHISDPRNILLNPFFALVLRGSDLRVELRHNALETPSQATTTLVTPARLTLPTRRWVTVTINARMATEASLQPFVRVWLDDRQIVDYRGLWGYVMQPATLAYAKAGLYHWTSGNAWDAAAPLREMMIGSMALISDATQRYERATVAASVAAPAN